MRKIDSVQNVYNLEAVVVYRQELERLIEIIKGGTEIVVVIVAGAYEYDSLDELQTKCGPVIAELTIRAQTKALDRFVHVEIGQKTTIIASGKMRAEQATELMTVLKPCERLLPRVPESIIGLTVLLSASAVGVGISGPVFNAGHTSAGFGVFLPVTILVAYALTQVGNVKSKIVLKRRHEHETFWKRHEESIARAIYTAIGSLITGLIVYYLTKK